MEKLTKDQLKELLEKDKKALSRYRGKTGPYVISFNILTLIKCVNLYKLINENKDIKQ
jgi:hypothetical protein